MGEEIEIRRDVELVNSQGLRHSLVLFWKASWKEDHYELTIDANRSRMIGCDEEDTTTLLPYQTRFAKSVISLYDGEEEYPKGVIERVYENGRPEISPDIKYYSEEEYPHREFALSCGIRASFCFPLNFEHGVMEIVSTRNQDVGTLETFCKSLEHLSGFRYNFRDHELLQDCRNSVLEVVLEAVCQRFDLPLTQYWYDDDDDYNLLRQFGDGNSEVLASWFQFKDVYLHMRFHCLLGYSNESARAFFCNNISALSITDYPLAHYARNCGSIACFTINLFSLLEKEEIKEEEEEGEEKEIEGEEKEIEEKEIEEEIEEEIEAYALQFFLPSQEMDNEYPQNLLNPIWTIVKESLANFKLDARERENLEKVLSVKVINSSSTQTEPASFELGQPQSSLPHCDGSELTPTLKMFEKGPAQNSNSNSYEEAAVVETSILNEASQPRRSEEYFKTKGKTMAPERDTHVEVSPDEDVEPVTPASKRLKKSKIPCTLENISKHFGRPIKDAAESFGLSVSTFKRRCRDVGIEWWESRTNHKTDGKSGVKNCSLDTSSLPNRRVVIHSSQDLNMMSVKITHEANTIRFELPSSFEELENIVIKKLHLDRKSFSLKYQDDEDDWVDMTCDEDVRECVKVWGSFKKPTIKMKLGPPINSYPG
ncbi:protein NLP3 isoform X2 [Daucus carota subsp. sativus]|uniref:protein NLP3 isoform X2 n=1 Tax=Daucus carota subsp. sativus TaxID=79200 RepID=UPI0007EF8466|nr:PREDICTED: protein NLP3-like isoform X2 [Daucus carota subsp. sativus]